MLMYILLPITNSDVHLVYRVLRTKSTESDVLSKSTNKQFRYNNNINIHNIEL